MNYIERLLVANDRAYIDLYHNGRDFILEVNLMSDDDTRLVVAIAEKSIEAAYCELNQWAKGRILEAEHRLKTEAACNVWENIEDELTEATHDA